MDTHHLKELRNRHEVIRYFDGYMSERFDDLTEKKLRRPLIKTQLLELRDGPEEIPSPTNLLLTELLQRHNVWTKQLDETMFLLHDEAEGEIGFLEVLRPRILAVYSPLPSDRFNRWVRRLVFSHPDLDYVWLSGLTL